MIESQTRKTSIFLIAFQVFLAITLAAGLAFCPGSVSKARANSHF